MDNKTYRCTLRPFDCSHYIDGHKCGFEHNDIEKCTYAIEEKPSFFLHDPELNKKLIAEGQKALQVLKLRDTFADIRTRTPEPMDEIEPDMIDREILANMRRRAVEERERMDSNFEYKKAKPADEKDLKEFDEQVTEVVDMNTNHEFPHDIAKALEYLKFEKKELRYYGKGENYRVKDAIIEFGIDGDSLMCRDVTSMKPLFIVNSSIGLGYFLVLLQSFGIYHKRYVYESVDGIVEEFIYSQGEE